MPGGRCHNFAHYLVQLNQVRLMVNLELQDHSKIRFDPNTSPQAFTGVAVMEQCGRFACFIAIQPYSEHWLSVFGKM